MVLCGRTAEKLWVFPKGTPEDGEEILDTALREVCEETGLLVEAGQKLGSFSYWFTSHGTRIHKRVHHWLMTAQGGDLANHDHEFDAVGWFDADAAARKLTYEDERRILADALRMLEVAE